MRTRRCSPTARGNSMMTSISTATFIKRNLGMSHSVERWSLACVIASGPKNTKRSKCCRKFVFPITAMTDTMKAHFEVLTESRKAHNPPLRFLNEESKADNSEWKLVGVLLVQEQINSFWCQPFPPRASPKLIKTNRLMTLCYIESVAL